uniref:Metal-dependent protein hydrolase n=1 Tax=Globisporangium ultimum (strain ATCC 200006 / CBS 805.95 / DAOM BR144) TaxID=431595 RepID=K3WFR7_GLOUD
MALPTAAANFVATSTCFSAFRNAKVTSSIATEGAKYIGTHNGTFHCDEALAVSMLKLLPKFAAHDILRTRDESKLSQCEAVVDVGGIYDHDALRYDHHQKTFDGVFNDEKNTKLSSAGLVYKHFGREIIQVLAGSTKLDDETLNLLHKKVYKNFVEHIDGIDNGVDVSSTGGPLNYQITTTLSNRVGYLNPGWNDDQSEAFVNMQFQQAMYLTVTEFTENILTLVNSWLPARSIVEDAINARFQTHASGEIVYFPQYCPWKSHLHDIEEKLLIKDQIKFVLYNDSTGNMVRVQGINLEGGSFALRQGIKTEWRGLRDDELSAVSGIPGCTFVHAGGFIGGNRTFEGALQMAIQSLPAATATESS